MAIQLAFAILALAFFAVQYFTRTDIPKIKGLPEAPGVPIFGSLFKMGNCHARAAGNWVKSIGPVFQVRLGNKVGRVISCLITIQRTNIILPVTTMPSLSGYFWNPANPKDNAD